VKKQIQHKCSNCGLVVTHEKCHVVSIYDGSIIDSVLFGKCKCGSTYYPLETCKKMSEAFKKHEITSREKLKRMFKKMDIIK
jgi:hypothetical protein